MPNIYLDVSVHVSQPNDQLPTQVNGLRDDLKDQELFTRNF